jgi:hypothetical protein
MSSGSVKVLQVSNISPSATKDQVQTLFAYIGRIDECKVSIIFSLHAMLINPLFLGLSIDWQSNSTKIRLYKI